MASLAEIFAEKLKLADARSRDGGGVTTIPDSPSTFFRKLPAELRLKVYAEVLRAPCPLRVPDVNAQRYLAAEEYDLVAFSISLLRISRLVYIEAFDVFHEVNTIWTSSQNLPQTLQRCEDFVRDLRIWPKCLSWTGPIEPLATEIGRTTQHLVACADRMGKLKTVTFECSGLKACKGTIRNAIIAVKLRHAGPQLADLVCTAVGRLTTSISSKPEPEWRFEYSHIYDAWQATVSTGLGLTLEQVQHNIKLRNHYRPLRARPLEFLADISPLLGNAAWSLPACTDRAACYRWVGTANASCYKQIKLKLQITFEQGLVMRQ